MMRVSDNGMSSVELGWVILDQAGKIWGDGQFFSDEAGAEATALRCVTPPYQVVPARRVVWITLDAKRHQKAGSVRHDILLGHQAQ